MKTPTTALILTTIALLASSDAASAQSWRQDAWQDDAPASATTSAPSNGWQPRATASSRTMKAPTTGQTHSSGRNVVFSDPASNDYRVKARQRARFVGEQQPEVIPPGTTELAPLADENAFLGDGNPAPSPSGCATCGGECGDQCGCDECDGAECGPPCCDFGYELFDGRCGRLLRDVTVFAGGDAFKGPLDAGTNGNFGLNEGINFAGPLGDPWGCGYQIGANFVQSNFSGAPTITVGDYNLRAAFRRQTFLTAGLFRRAECCGFQGGVAFDYLHDEYYQQADLKQIRSETGFVINDSYEIGYYGAYGVGTDRVLDGKLDPTDMFALYVRRYFDNGGEGRIWGGATGNGDGLLGADLWVPLGKGFAIENRINYMIPKEGTGSTAQPRESWGLTIQLVWYPGQNASCMKQNPFRALFNVADNSLFMVDRLAQ